MNKSASTIARFSRNALVVLVVLALGLRSLIPTGYMPDFSAGNSVFSLMACDGMEHMDHAHMHHGDMHHGDESHNGACPFAAGATASFAGVSAPVVATPAFLRPLVLAPPVVVVLRQSAFGNASPRSPPRFS